MNPFGKKVVGHYSENKNKNITSTRFIVEEQTYKEQEGIAKCKFIMDQRKKGKNNGEKSPEIE